MTLQHIAAAPSVRWMSPAAGLWVASRPGEHAGMIERVDGRYVARTARATVVGTFDDLSDAQSAIEERGSGAGRVRELTRRMLGANAAIGSLLAIVAGGFVMR